MRTTQSATPANLASEPSSARPLIAMIVAAVGVYAFFAIVLVLGATVAGVRGLAWLVVPGVLFFAAAVSLIASLAPVRQRLGEFKAWFVEGGSRERAGKPVRGA
jgi:hypothetical protein